MKRRVDFKMIAGMAIALLVAAAFGTALAADTVKIGMLYWVTGPGSSLGPIQMQSAKLAVKEMNDAGGVKIGGKKYKIEVIERDDESKPDVGIRRVNELVQDNKVHAVVGGTFAHISLAMNGQSKKDKFFLMTTNGVPDSYFTKAEK